MNRYNFKEVEKYWQSFWIDNQTFKTKKDKTKKRNKVKTQNRKIITLL